MDHNLPPLFGGEIHNDRSFWEMEFNENMQDGFELFDNNTGYATNNQDSFQNASSVMAGPQAGVPASASVPPSTAPFFQPASQPYAPLAIQNSNTSLPGPPLRFNTTAASPSLQTRRTTYEPLAQINESPFQFGQPNVLDPRLRFPPLNQPQNSQSAVGGANPIRPTPSQTLARTGGNHTSSFAPNNNASNTSIDVATPTVNNQPGLQVLFRATLLSHPYKTCLDLPEATVDQDVQIRGPQGIDCIILARNQPLNPTEKMCGSKMTSNVKLPRGWVNSDYQLPDPKVDRDLSMNGYSLTVFRGTGRALKHFTPAMEFKTNTHILRNKARTYPPGSNGEAIYNAALMVDFHATFGKNNIKHQSNQYRHNFVQEYQGRIQSFPADVVPTIQAHLDILRDFQLSNDIRLLLTYADIDESDIHLGDLGNKTRVDLCTLIMEGEPFVQHYENACDEREYRRVQAVENVLRSVKQLLPAKVGFPQKTFLLSMAMVIWPTENFKTNSIALNAFIDTNKSWLNNLMTNEKILMGNAVAHRAHYQSQLDRGAISLAPR